MIDLVDITKNVKTNKKQINLEDVYNIYIWSRSNI